MLLQNSAPHCVLFLDPEVRVLQVLSDTFTRSTSDDTMERAP